MSEDEMKLSRLDRYYLSNQLRILEALYPDEADSIAVQREALERGYEMLYAWSTEHICDGRDVMTREESLEVWDTLDMFDAIQRSGTDEQKESHFAKFNGYDGNNESKFMAFAAFTVERLDRFGYVKMAREGYFNSHMPIRQIYQRMLEEWRTVPTAKRHDLSTEVVQRILDAAAYPED